MKRFQSFLFLILFLNLSTINAMKQKNEKSSPPSARDMTYIEIENLYMNELTVGKISQILNNLATYNQNLFLYLLIKICFNSSNVPLQFPLYAQLAGLCFFKLRIYKKKEVDLVPIKIINSNKCLSKRVLRLLDAFIYLQKNGAQQPLSLSGSRILSLPDRFYPCPTGQIYIFDLPTMRNWGRAKVKTKEEILNREIFKKKRKEGFLHLLH